MQSCKLLQNDIISQLSKSLLYLKFSQSYITTYYVSLSHTFCPLTWSIQDGGKHASLSLWLVCQVPLKNHFSIEDSPDCYSQIAGFLPFPLWWNLKLKIQRHSSPNAGYNRCADAIYPPWQNGSWWRTDRLGKLYTHTKFSWMFKLIQK